MTFSARKRAECMENELRMWWALSLRGWHLVRNDPTNVELAEIADEVEVMLEMTEWPTLRTAMLRGLERHAEMALPVLRKADVA